MATTAGPDLSPSLALRATKAAQTWCPGAEIVNLRPLLSGASSLTYLANVSGGADSPELIVLKSAPPGLPAVRNRDILRQARVLRALDGQPGVRTPRVYFASPGDPPGVPPFMAMSFVAGECHEPVLEEARDPHMHDLYRSRALSAATALAAIHRVHPRSAGLSDDPVVSITDEIDRWTAAFETVSEDLQGDYRRIAHLLHAAAPQSRPVMINHGDYRLGNTICIGGRVAAVLDWEIWSLGDPRVDLAWLRFFTDEARHPGAPSSAPTGMPTADELTEAYVSAGGGVPDDLGWFDAMTRYKEAAATALLIKRGRKAGPLSATLARMLPALPDLLHQAERLVRG